MVSDVKTFPHKGCIIASAKKVFTDFFLHLFTPFKSFFAPTFLSVFCYPKISLVTCHILGVASHMQLFYFIFCFIFFFEQVGAESVINWA